jgi:2-hydroxychromene-2-carboxylate isomerase
MSEIEYFYSAHSAYAYLGSARFMEIARAAGRRIRHKPVDLRKVVPAAGAAPFRARSEAHYGYYFGREIERWAEFRGVPVLDRIPTHHANPLELANGMLIAAERAGADVDALAHAILSAHWVDDADHADRATLAAIGASLGLDPEPLLDAALTPEIQALHDANTDEAIRRSVFGSPTYVVDGDMFYGQDHLEMVERALDQPFKDAWGKKHFA